MNEPLDIDRIAQIRSRLQSHDTEELLEIWQVHDEGSWTPEALEAVRQIIRERLGEVPEILRTEYFCSECGAPVTLADRICPVCGANVEDVEEDSGETDDPDPMPSSWEPGHALTPLATAFFVAAAELPEEYAAHLDPSISNEMIIPAREPKVGDLKVRLLESEIIVSVGRQIKSVFLSPSEAVKFIQDILDENIVFHFDDGQVEIYRLDDLTVEEMMDWSNYVWSGPLRNKQTGIDWYRP